MFFCNRFNFQNNFWGCMNLSQTLSYRDIFFCPNSVLYYLAFLPKWFCSFGISININILIDRCNLLGCSVDFNKFFLKILQMAEFCSHKNLLIWISLNTQNWKMAAKWKEHFWVSPRVQKLYWAMILKRCISLFF